MKSIKIYSTYLCFLNTLPQSRESHDAGRNRHVYEMDEHYNEIYKDIFDVFMGFEHPSLIARNPMTAGRNRHVNKMDEHYNEIYIDIFDVFMFLNTLPPEPGIP
ncbi:hypothetical protein CDAR_294431 [Caerostris darwini]|uniref:Uncharacterized protein n=1 Tax=Caerostris darwini TaxID=1538125 RepID=A0AAV4UK03_9ARAC|nr:hypothetical protein CDAR_294431 [Caerostris darwini]